MGPTWVLPASDGPHVGPMKLAIRGSTRFMNWYFVFGLLFACKLDLVIELTGVTRVAMSEYIQVDLTIDTSVSLTVQAMECLLGKKMFWSHNGPDTLVHVTPRVHVTSWMSCVSTAVKWENKGFSFSIFVQAKCKRNPRTWWISKHIKELLTKQNKQAHVFGKKHFVQYTLLYFVTWYNSKPL